MRIQIEYIIHFVSGSRWSNSKRRNIKLLCVTWNERVHRRTMFRNRHIFPIRNISAVVYQSWMALPLIFANINHRPIVHLLDQRIRNGFHCFIDPAKICTIPTKENISSPCFLFQKILLKLDVWPWVLIFTHAVSQIFECSGCFGECFFTNGWSTSFSFFARVSFSLIISFLFCGRNVWFSTTPLEVVIDIFATTISMLEHFPSTVSFITSLQYRIFRRLDL